MTSTDKHQNQSTHLSVAAPAFQPRAQHGAPSCIDQEARSSVSSESCEKQDRGSARKSTREKKEAPNTKGPADIESTRKEESGSRSGYQSSSSAGRGSRNANHLLGFNYGGGTVSGRSSGRGDGGGRRSGRSAGATSQIRRYANNRPQKYNKDKFLQANFRFLVSDAVEVEQFAADADRMFSWDDVVQVEMMSNAPSQCPISLDSPPVCPQITPCGHVYSFPSIMQHLINYGGTQLRASAPCPLCFQPVVARELRLVTVRHTDTISVGGPKVRFTLLQRPKGSIIPHPATSSAGDSGSTSAKMENLSLSGAAAVSPLSENLFVKFATIGDATPLWRQAAEELAAYAAVVTSEGGMDAAFEAPFIYSALDALALRARNWTRHRAELLEQKGLLPGSSGSAAAIPGGGAGMGGLPDVMGAAAEAAVKRLFTVAVHHQEEETEAAAYAQPKEDFPALSAPPPSKVVLLSTIQKKDNTRQHQPASEEPGEFSFEAAFSDGEGAGDCEAAASEGAGDCKAAASEEQGEMSLGTRPVDLSVGQPQDMVPLSSPTGSSMEEARTSSLGALEGTSPPGSSPLGCSPASLQMLNATSASHEYYSYQASDGQWVFLDPLSLRCLLHHYTSYEACPASLEAQVLEMDDVVQDEQSRRRWKFLAHLPSTGAFRLAQVDLSSLLPAKSLEPFAEELAARERSRKRRAAEIRKEKAREAAAAKAERKARQGPSLKELAAMPALGSSQGNAAAADSSIFLGASPASESDLINIALAASIEDQAPTPVESSGAPSSFAHLVKLGFAATGPSLVASTASPQPDFPSVASSGPWGTKAPAAPAGAWGAASSSKAPATFKEAELTGAPPGSGKKGKKGVVLFTSGAQRRY